MNRELTRYPRPTPRYLYLGVIIIASIILWYEYFVPTTVAQILLVRLHMSFRYLIFILVLSQLAGTGAAIAAQITDRIGRCWVVIVGLGIVSAIQAFVFPALNNKVELTVVLTVIGLFEGIILVATPALVRDFSPQLGRASAMGFWTLGPVAGLLAATGITAATLGATSSDWQREIIISGIAGLAIFVVALLFLRELSPPIRDQLMVTERDRVLVELKAKGVDVESALKKPWRQMLRFDIVISAVAVNVLLILFYTASGTFPTAFFVTVFDKATHWSIPPRSERHGSLDVGVRLSGPGPVRDPERHPEGPEALHDRRCHRDAGVHPSSHLTRRARDLTYERVCGLLFHGRLDLLGHLLLPGDGVLDMDGKLHRDL